MWTKAKQMLPKDILIHARKLEGEEITQAVADAIKEKRKRPAQTAGLGLTSEMLSSYYDDVLRVQMNPFWRSNPAL